MTLENIAGRYMALSDQNRIGMLLLVPEAASELLQASPASTYTNKQCRWIAEAAEALVASGSVPFWGNLQQVLERTSAGPVSRWTHIGTDGLYQLALHLPDELNSLCLELIARHGAMVA